MADDALVVPDWILTRIVDHGPGTYYRYCVEGRNLNWPEEHPMYKFSWRIPASRLADPRYDTSNAERVDAV